MPKHKSVIVSGAVLADLLLVHMDDAEIANALGCPLEDTAIGPVAAVPQSEMYEVSWPEHVLIPRFNSDATYHPLNCGRDELDEEQESRLQVSCL